MPLNRQVDKQIAEHITYQVAPPILADCAKPISVLREPASRPRHSAVVPTSVAVQHPNSATNHSASRASLLIRLDASLCDLYRI